MALSETGSGFRLNAGGGSVCPFSPRKGAIRRKFCTKIRQIGKICLIHLVFQKKSNLLMERSLLNEFFAVPLIGGTGGNGFFDTFLRAFH